MDIPGFMQYLTEPEKRSEPSWMSEYQSGMQKPGEKMALNQDKEAEFKNWLQGLDWYKNIQSKEQNNPNLFEEITGPSSDYDYRRAFASGVSPKAYEFDTQQHWPSSTPRGEMLKSPNHPTAWMEHFMRENQVDPNEFGLNSANEAAAWHKSNAPVVDSVNAIRGLFGRILK